MVTPTKRISICLQLQTTNEEGHDCRKTGCIWSLTWDPNNCGSFSCLTRSTSSDTSKEEVSRKIAPWAWPALEDTPRSTLLSSDKHSSRSDRLMSDQLRPTIQLRRKNHLHLFHRSVFYFASDMCHTPHHSRKHKCVTAEQGCLNGAPGDAKPHSSPQIRVECTNILIAASKQHEISRHCDENCRCCSISYKQFKLKYCITC
jgi:hypothetical protein